MAKKDDAWVKGYKEAQARYLEELRKERELKALKAAAKELRR